MPGERLVMITAVLAAVAACSSTKSGSGTVPPAALTSSPTGSPDGAATGAGTNSTPSSASAQPSTGSAPSSTGGAAGSVRPAPSHPVRTATVRAFGSSPVYPIEVWVQTTDVSCAAHAYGAPVIATLRAHPCRGLSRLLATTTVKGRRVGFAQSSLAFLGTAPKDYETARKFRELVTQDGTGNINDLLREGWRLPSGPTAVPTPNAFSATGEDAGVVIVEAWYLVGPTPQNDPPLVAMAHDILLAY